MTVLDPRPRLPFVRPNLLELAPAYAVLRREAPIVAVTTPAGDDAWLVTRFDDVRELLGDPRLGRSHPDPAGAARISDAAVLEGPSGEYDTEARDHARMRRLLTPAFSAKRIRGLEGRVEELVETYLDELVAAHESAPDGVVDLHRMLAAPLPVAVICELLGVPFEDRDRFGGLADRMARFTGDDARRARAEFEDYVSDLTDLKRRHPGEDVLTDLVRAHDADADFDHAAMVRLCVGLIFAGHETTVNRIGVGAVMLLDDRDRDQWTALTADPEGRVGAVVEEVLRLGAPGDLGLVRYAHTDVERDGTLIARGEAVVLSVNAANRDPESFADAEDFDPDRSERAHVGFGHGAHFCIGASLARTELRAAFAALARRVPGLRLAVAPDDLEVRHDRVTGGLRALPVTW